MTRLSCLLFLMLPVLLFGQPPWDRPRPPQKNQNNDQPPSLSFNGTEWFRLALANQNLEPETDLQNAFNHPESTLIMILGDTAVLNPYRNQLLDYLREGGALLVASDYPHTRMGWNNLFGISIPDARIYDNVDCYPSYPYCPYITPASPRENIEDSATKIFRRVEGPRGDPTRRLLTNEAGVLQFLGNAPRGVLREDLGYFSNNARLGFGGRALFQGKIGVESFAVGFHFPNRGKCIFLSDHSVFINNSMMVSVSPTGDGLTFGSANYDFSEDTADWLAESGPVRKSKCILIVDGRVQQVFALPPPPIPDLFPPPDLLAQAFKNMINPVLDSLQRDDYFNRQIRQFLNRILTTKGWLWLAIGVALVLLALAGGRKLLATTKRQSEVVVETKPPTLKETLEKQTLQEMLSAQDWLFAARRRVREWLLRFGIDLKQKKLPLVLFAEGSQNVAAYQKALQRLWNIAQGEVQSFNLEKWDRFNSDLEQLAQAAKRGEWTFAVEEKGSR